MKRYYIAMVILAVVAAASIGTHYALTYKASFDQQKVSDINALQIDVDNYARTNGQLPANLSDLTVESGLKERLKDYSYSPLASPEFQLCATFEAKASSRYGSSDEPYNHGAGYQCFKMTAYALEYR